jgi:hypothetical protein
MADYGDLREQLEARERWWRDRYAELWQQDLIPAVKAWATIQYRRIQRKERAWVRQALVDMLVNDQAPAAPESRSEQDPRGADTSDPIRGRERGLEIVK